MENTQWRSEEKKSRKERAEKIMCVYKSKWKPSEAKKAKQQQVVMILIIKKKIQQL